MSGLMDIPGLGGILQARQMNEQSAQRDQASQLGQLQQMGALQGILAKVQAAQQEQAFRGALAKLGPNPSQESLAQLAAQFSPAKDILTSQTASADRRAALESANLNRADNRDQRTFELQERGVQAKALQDERLAAQAGALKQRAEDQSLSRAEQNQARMDLARFMVENRQPPQPRNLQLTADAEGNQLIVNPDGTTTPLQAPGGAGGVRKAVGTDKPMTEFQGKAALYGTRSAQSDKVLKALEDKINVTGLAMGQATGVVGNALMSSEQQRVDQAQRDFVNAVLRQESGAVISDSEFSNAKRQYFPTPGDTPNVISQKRANRQLAIQGFARMSGPKGAADIKAIIDEPLLPGAPATTPTPRQAGTAPPSTWDDAKERRYQELLRKRGGS